MYDKDMIKQNLAVEDIYSIVEELGGNPTRHGACLMIDTICHSLPGEGSHKLYYYDNTKLFNCYTGCSDFFDIFDLVAKVMEIQHEEKWSVPRAIHYIAVRFGFAPSEEGFSEGTIEDWAILKNLERIESLKDEKGKEVSLKKYDDKILSSLSRVVIAPWLAEGISMETIKRFEILYYPKDAQIIIPHRDMNGALIGIRGRALVKEEADLYGKYRPARINYKMYNHPLGFSLYGLHLNKENIRVIRKVIIFEGEKSVMLYNSYFGSENNISVACCGSSISMHQFELLLALGVQEVIIAFDRQFQEIGDKEFKVHTKNLKKIADKFKNYVTVSCLFDRKKRLGYKSSPIDHGVEVFTQLFQERIIL